MTKPTAAQFVPAFRCPGSSDWRPLAAADDSADSENDKTKSNREDLKNVLLASLQMQHVVVLAGSGCSLSATGPSMGDLWKHAVGQPPSDHAKNVAEKVRHDIEKNRNETIAKAVEAGQWDHVIDYVNREVFDKPEDFYTLDKLRKAAAVDRRLTLREILEKVFRLIPRFKSKDELLEEEFAKFVADFKPEEAEAIPAIKTFFKAYVSSDQLRHIIDSKDYTVLATHPMFSTRDFKAVPAKYRALVPEYVKDYVSLNQFAV